MTETLSPPFAPSDPARTARVTGAFLVASALLVTAGAAILSTVFDWPAILDEPGATVLPAFAQDEQLIRLGFILMLFSSLALIPAAYGLEAVLTRSSPAARAVTAFGVAGALFQLLGWVRWPVTVPYLSDAYATAADDAARQVTASSFDVLNRYAGAALGEHLGWLLQAVWAVGIAVLALRGSTVPRWFSWLGLALAAIWAVLVPGAGLLQWDRLNSIGQPVYTLWYLWLLGLGVLLLRRPVRP
jgi:hypothetical protein